MKLDIKYINHGMFTRFYPETKDGEYIYNEIAAHNGGVAAVLSIHADAVVRQIKAAGYKVGKAKPSKMVISDDELLELLEA